MGLALALIIIGAMLADTSVTLCAVFIGLGAVVLLTGKKRTASEDIDE